MSGLIVACIRTSESTVFDLVTTMRNKIAKNLPLPYTMVCLTNQPERCSDVTFVDISAFDLLGWWNKMVVFEPLWRGRAKVIYLDLDIDVVGDLSPLADVPGEFAILSQKHVAGRYNSGAMVLGGGMGNFVWHGFERRRELLMMTHRLAGPSSCIEELYPSAPFLQRLLPPDFFENHLRWSRLDARRSL
ncbi:hypothetical protein [Bradyrhizobium japonicum]|uniref:hypothetical protein n=1 Tax=Bradyrhizobium japonicum TaxID=375 RepID=UPI001E4121FB|nr:hypothetical protein [Bradyrhizobium japonicum]MCD9821201.1 hypothetical protein [Bradyrhizobium japonicum]MEB2674103.1 hypothetical protein [Bradyrhizobium japonicum]WRI93290.1 hypothetical protein R3F75_21095 [Bradyrhizobium japonicum]